MDSHDQKALQREILLGFWKIHILHHAAEGPVVGQWMLQELRVATFAQAVGVKGSVSAKRVRAAVERVRLGG